ncbi:MAG: hypothetical protein RLZZ08_770 [Pseudomonadota bacterium]|jgi:hypothetical protein
MNGFVTLALTVAAAATSTTTYTVQSTVTKNYYGASYSSSTLSCKSGTSVYTETVNSAPAGFGQTAYYANAIPYTNTSMGAMLVTQGRYNTFDDAAKKACTR